MQCCAAATRGHQPVIKKGNSSATIYLDCHIAFTLWSLRASSKLFSKSHINGDASHARPASILHLDCAIRRLGAVEVVQHNLHGVHSPSHPTSLSPPSPSGQAHQPGSLAENLHINPLAGARILKSGASPIFKIGSSFRRFICRLAPGRLGSAAFSV